MNYAAIEATHLDDMSNIELAAFAAGVEDVTPGYAGESLDAVKEQILVELERRDADLSLDILFC